MRTKNQNIQKVHENCMGSIGSNVGIGSVMVMCSTDDGTVEISVAEDRGTGAGSIINLSI
jgi:hypothetical protein